MEFNLWCAICLKSKKGKKQQGSECQNKGLNGCQEFWKEMNENILSWILMNAKTRVLDVFKVSLVDR